MRFWATLKKGSAGRSLTGNPKFRRAAMHTDPFGWLLPKNDRLLWVRGLPPPGSAQVMEPVYPGASQRNLLGRSLAARQN